MKRSIAVVVAVVAFLFGSAGPSAAWGDDDHNKKKDKSERCDDDHSCKRSGNDDCRNAKERCSDDDLNIDIDKVYICVVPGSCPPDEGGSGEDEEEDEYADKEKPDEEPEQPAPDEEEEEEDEYADEKA